MVLAAKAVTDFSLPFGFNVRVGDLLASTDADTGDNAGTSADSLQIYRFADSAGYYRFEPFYVSRLGTVQSTFADKTDTMLARSGGGYCVYNPYSSPMTLTVPPLPVSMSKVVAASAKKTKAALKAWAVAVRGRTSDGMRLSTVYCGHQEGKTSKSYLPAMPLMDGIGIRVCDEGYHRYGHAIAQSLTSTEGGETFTLALCNQSGAPKRILYGVGAGRRRCQAV